MIRIRPAAERGRTRLGWLDSAHSFSFGDYHDPRFEGFSKLRVVNDDRVAPGGGFPTHGHRDMEILSWVLDGALEHRDSLGTGSVIRPGEIQRMTAGTGVLHSEYNASKAEPVRFLLLWILPERRGLLPSYEQKAVAPGALEGRFALLAAPEGEGGAVTIRQDVRLLAARLASGASASVALAPGRRAWVQVARGSVHLGSSPLEEGDGAAVEGEALPVLRATGRAEVLVFDLP